MTADNDWLVFTPTTPIDDVTGVRVETVSSPSWVAWKDIRVLGVSASR